jgi:hypothetical protein
MLLAPQEIILLLQDLLFQLLPQLVVAVEAHHLVPAAMVVLVEVIRALPALRAKAR